MDKKRTLEALAALSQETRLDAFRLLIQVGAEGLPAGEIGDRLSVKQNTMSANLSVLAQAGLIRSVREGRSIRYFADFDGMQGLLSYLLENCCGGDPEQCQPFIAKLGRCC
ncbi:ArsR/SmtB family transcription factor [Asticcacaulis excentricus]|uniref:Regulatory protein ArsR n=1 Tax=Asticcacaulis excentricus (strain ATCC 15261 / DSM 4724 / KCTC 12464 / NCIMB 9791 / VKM B-1370 / CB 48) TaxID=573065 RepID=E8RM41_ASTEC|nr:helix-turn-helix domain-containing protein [Asticcacaulis excentricus]ADU12733.1 regulatory protein ArsR [Asticcacaulis excentricus CB 48]